MCVCVRERVFKGRERGKVVVMVKGGGGNYVGVGQWRDGLLKARRLQPEQSCRGKRTAICTGWRYVVDQSWMREL